MKFNINHNVKVRLTDHGRAVHREEHTKFWQAWAKLPEPYYHAPKEDADGWSTWQLHSLMRAFGQHVNMGCPLCFETDIEIIEGQE